MRITNKIEAVKALRDLEVGRQIVVAEKDGVVVGVKISDGPTLLTLKYVVEGIMKMGVKQYLTNPTQFIESNGNPLGF
jgi:hypothetical protein